MFKIIAYTPRLDAWNIMLERNNLLMAYQMFLIGIERFIELSARLDAIEDNAVGEAYEDIERGE